MPRWVWPEMSPWKRHALTIPPDSPRAWIQLVTWEAWMGVLVAGALGVGIQLLITAPDQMVTVFDLTNCNTHTSIAAPCERVTYRAGALNVVMNAWCGALLVVVGMWLLWELWSATAPKPITDDFLRLLDDSFGRSWRSPRTWPWTRLAWTYGFTLVGAGLTIGVWMLVSTLIAS